MKSNYTYAKAGVDITQISKIHRRIETILSKTFTTRRERLVRF